LGAATKVVLDTNIYASALGWKGPERSLYELCLHGKVELYISDFIVSELQRVLAYPKFNFPLPQRIAFIQDLLRVANAVEVVNIPNLITDDPDDNNILGCAEAAGADYLITGDSHLLNLASYGSIIICAAGAFLKHYPSH
jgi:putative PIN family toxin of toxin-antitoxin system